MTMKDLVVVGSLNYDIMTVADRLPNKGETFSVDSITHSAGGKGINQAFQAARLGLGVKFFGCLGLDVFGDFIINNVKDEKLDMNHVSQTKSPTGMGLVNILKDGSVYANIYPGANFDVDIEYINKNIDDILDTDLLILQLEIPVESVKYLIRKAKDRGVKIILNAAPAKDISFDALSAVDILIVNESEAEFYIGLDVGTPEKALLYGENFAKKLGTNLIITLGEKGSVYFTMGEKGVVDAVKPDALEDTTGAGDSFIGAFAYAYKKGYTIREACNFAAFIASKTVAKVGAQSAMPKIDEVENDSRFKTKFHIGRTE